MVLDLKLSTLSILSGFKTGSARKLGHLICIWQLMAKAGLQVHSPEHSRTKSSTWNCHELIALHSVFQYPQFLKIGISQASCKSMLLKSQSDHFYSLPILKVSKWNKAGYKYTYLGKRKNASLSHFLDSYLISSYMHIFCFTSEIILKRCLSK